MLHNDVAAAATGSTAVTAPLWLQYLDPAFQFLIAALGLCVLILTVWNKWLEIRLKRRALQDAEEAADGETCED